MAMVNPNIGFNALYSGLLITVFIILSKSIIPDFHLKSTIFIKKVGQPVFSFFMEMPYLCAFHGFLYNSPILRRG
ncbi:MAG: hypothetical protein MR871_14025 [Lachnospiraceae bacterium]|nr:hypothetical protein [Lachnospiraceae bacterium]